LLTLGKIICLLSERQNAPSILSHTNSNSNNNAAILNSSGVSSITYLPYRESVLTWLLKESLGGNAKTAMLATVNASNLYIEETLCTLRYAAKTMCIKNSAHMNQNFKQKFINEFGQETEMNLVLPPLSTLESNSSNNNELLKRTGELELTIKQMEQEWKDKLEKAEHLKQKEIKDMQKNLIVLYENETRSQNVCLINLNEDPSLSEKLIYLLKQDDNSLETLIGSDKNLVNIHLSGALIAPSHAKIIKESNDQDLAYFIEQLDENYLTYLNGDVLNSKERYKLTHGDRIIFGGSHFFRFNNPLSIKNKNSTILSNNGNLAIMDQFKDYQFAKNEIERKQNEIIQKKLNEALDKCKEDGDLKLRELKQEYEKNIELIVISYLFFNSFMAIFK
jgi:kinesin family protein 14